MINNIHKNFLKKYIDRHQKVINLISEDLEFFEKISDQISFSLMSGGTIFWCGNGGSMADASHLAAELVGKYESVRQPLKSIALGHDNAILSCIANDYDYEKVFSRQLLGLASKKDYLVILSTSGNSKNIIDVAKTADAIGLKSFALLGKGGGEYCKLNLDHYLVKEDKTSIIQEAHITIGHLIIEFVESKLNIKLLN